jgi:hypothetical protein
VISRTCPVLIAATLFVASSVAETGEARAERRDPGSDATRAEGTVVASLDVVRRDHRKRDTRASRRRSSGDEARREASRRDHRDRSARSVRRDHRDRDARRSGGDTRRSRRVVRRDHRRYARPPARRGHVAVGGTVVVSGGVYAGPRRYACCADPVPAYYEPPPERVAPEPDPRPTWAFGAFAGGAEINESLATGDLGLLGRARLSRSFELEGELSRARSEDGTRVDRNLGAALLYNMFPYSTFSPYLLAGLGASHSEAYGGALEAGYGYGELGGGLVYRLSDRFSFTGDLRVGSRHTDEEALKSGPLAADEGYARMRLGALLYF